MNKIAQVVLGALSLALVACGSDSSSDEESSDSGDSGDGGGEQNGDGQDGSDSSPSVPAGSCDMAHCDAPDLFTCFQWGADDAEHRDLCEQYGGTVGDGACPTDGVVGGCKTASPFSGEGCVVNWSYPPITAQNVQESCDDDDGVVVQP